ncbi:MAG: ABC transporter permease [Armatimonadota bacterium]
MLTDLRLEFRKLVRKPRTYMGPGAMMLIMTAMLLGLKYGHQFDYMKETMGQDFIIAGNLTTAAFLARYLLEGIFFFFMPLAVSAVCGDLLASEASDGTLRMILCRPITRFKLITSKYIAGILYTIVLTMGTGLIAYIAGSIFLGRGSLFTLPDMRQGSGIWILPEDTAIIRLTAAYALTSAGMLAVGSIAFMISTFLSNSNGAVFGSMGVLIISGILGQIEYFEKIKPYLLTTYLDKWQQFFGSTLDTDLLMKSAGVMLIYSAAAFIIGAVIFQRRDILS